MHSLHAVRCRTERILSARKHILTVKGSAFMSKDIKKAVINELDRRIALLKEHQSERIITTGDQYEELNQALSKVIGVPLTGELESIREFVQTL